MGCRSWSSGAFCFPILVHVNPASAVSFAMFPSSVRVCAKLTYVSDECHMSQTVLFFQDLIPAAFSVYKFLLCLFASVQLMSVPMSSPAQVRADQAKHMKVFVEFIHVCLCVCAGREFSYAVV